MQKGIFSIAVLFVLSCGQLALAQTKPATAPANKPPTASKGTLINKAVDSLYGHTVYVCNTRNYVELSEVKGPDGTKYDLFNELKTMQIPTGSKMLIQGVELAGDRMVTEVGKVYQINLNVLNQENQVSAGVMVEVKAADMTPERILNSLDSFRTHPIPKSIRIGMSEGDVYCIEGLPDQTNTNAIGDDQMVYRDSDLYVYIGKNGRVVNFQESR